MKCRHTKSPTGYVAWHEWAEKKAKTHEQERCPNCGLWAVWVKRSQRPADEDRAGGRNTMTRFADGDLSV